MKKFILWLAVLTFFVGGGSLRTFAAVDLASRDFPLSSPVGAVTGVWNKDTQELTIIGSGKIDNPKWYNLKTNTLKLDKNALSGIIFTKDVKFPDNTFYNGQWFFSNFKTANIIFDPQMDTSNVTTMQSMFSNTRAFNQPIGDWNTSKVRDMSYMFAGASVFNQPIGNWDTSNVTTMASMFAGARTFDQAIGDWDTSKVANMQSMFSNARAFNQLIKDWNTSKVANMAGMFNGASAFNQSINTWTGVDWKVHWDTSNVTTMYEMFSNTRAFNQPIGDWNTSKVTNMASMFSQAKAFDQPIGDWNTSKVIDMPYMFAGASVFNQPIGNWDTSKVTTMYRMFEDTKAFNQPIKNWNTSNVTTMQSMFSKTKVFDQSINTWTGADWKVHWDTSKVTDMSYMFYDTEAFNQPIKNWNTSNVTAMYRMFGDTKAFNQPIGNWNTSKVTNMREMFRGARAFNQPIGDWNTSKVINMAGMFYRTEAFNQDISTFSFDAVNWTNAKEFIAYSNMSVTNYDKLLVRRQNDYPTKKLDFTSLRPVKYCTAYQERQNLLDAWWILNDAWADCELKLEINQPTKISSGNITDTEIIVRDLLPLDPAKIRVDPSTTLTYENFSCASVPSSDEKEVKCSLTITAAVPTQKLVIQATDAVNTTKEASVVGYLIDRIEPSIGHLDIKVNPLEPNKAKVKMLTLPHDIWGAGTDHCELLYTGNTGPGIKIDNILLNIDYDLEFQSEQVHTINLLCYDKAGNHSTNEFKFPPIITFDPANITISKDTMSGKFMVFSPSNANIQTITLVAQGTEALLWTCTSQIDNGTTSPWKNTPEKPIICEFSNVKNTGKVLIKAKDDSWAEGQNSQSFLKDTVAPTITFSSTEMITGGSITITGHIFDAVGVSSGNVSLWVATNLVISQQSCIQIDKNNVQCSFIVTDEVINGSISIEVVDNAWNIYSESSSGYIIDKTPPTITSLTGQLQNSWTALWVTFSGADAGVGLWSLSESGNVNFNPDAILYGIASDSGCSDVSFLNHLDPQETEPFDLSFQFSDASQNGKYLCIILKDKLGNTQTGYLSSPINLDLGAPFLPLLSDQTATLWTAITPIVITATDNGTIVSWTVAGLPAGLTFESTTGSLLETLTITGTVTAPTGTYSVIILVKDNEGNESTQTFTITVKAPAPSSSGSSGGGSYAGGGGQSFPNPQSPKPISPTSQKPTENKNLTYSDEELFNPTINDGKCYFRRPHQGILTSKRVQTTEEFNKALSFLWSYEMTKFDGVDGYDPYRNLSRQEAAKIFSNFAINVLCRQPDKNLTVNYSDILNTDPSLTPYITLAYQLGLMKGSGMGDWEFRPFDFISKAEVNAVLIRMILKSYLNEKNLTHWFTNYNEVAKKLGIINQWAGLQSVPRNDVALMLFRAYKNQVFDRREIDYFSYVLKTRDTFVMKNEE